MVDRLFAEPALAALYDPMCPRQLRADFDFYLPRVMAAGSVLDVGCGTCAMLHEVEAPDIQADSADSIRPREC